MKKGLCMKRRLRIRELEEYCKMLFYGYNMFFIYEFIVFVIIIYVINIMLFESLV